jgi:hypothetical protein
MFGGNQKNVFGESSFGQQQQKTLFGATSKGDVKQSKLLNIHKNILNK